jgi:hypothetical protein
MGRQQQEQDSFWLLGICFEILLRFAMGRSKRKRISAAPTPAVAGEIHTSNLEATRGCG